MLTWGGVSSPHRGYCHPVRMGSAPPRGPGLITAQAFKGVPHCTQAVIKASVVVWSQRARVPSACTRVLLGGRPRLCRVHPRSSTGPRGGIGEGWGSGRGGCRCPMLHRRWGPPLWQHRPAAWGRRAPVLGEELLCPLRTLAVVLVAPPSCPLPVSVSPPLGLVA